LKPLNLSEYESLARDRLDPMAYDYFRSGAADERTLHDNLAAFERVRLLPRVLVDVSGRSTATTCLGTELSMPVAVAPTAFHGLAHPEAEKATARAAAAAGTAMTVSTLSNTSLEDVAATCDGPMWFQLYVFRDRGLTEELVRRAVESGFRAILVTVDAPLLGSREADVRNRFELPEGLTIASVEAGQVAAPGRAAGSGLAAYFADLLDPSLGWEDLEWLVGLSDLPVAVKGVHRPDDATQAMDSGAAGVVVSNHGARQLDTVPASLDMLPAIVDAVGEGVEVLMDGGVRRGTDVIKALALGASAVLIGRPVIWALAVDGEAGVSDALELLRTEIDLAMALCGCSSVSDIGPELLAPAGPWR
jgi:4-hydroxymandelate oxidase